MNSDFTESVVEEAALEWFAGLGYAVCPGPQIAPGEATAERDDFGHVVLHRRLRDALGRLNPGLPTEAIADAFRRLTLIDGPSTVMRNHALHRMLVDGVNVEYRNREGRIVEAQVRVLDFDAPANNDWLAPATNLSVPSGGSGPDGHYRTTNRRARSTGSCAIRAEAPTDQVPLARTEPSSRPVPVSD